MNLAKYIVSRKTELQRFCFHFNPSFATLFDLETLAVVYWLIQRVSIVHNIFSNTYRFHGNTFQNMFETVLRCKCNHLLSVSPGRLVKEHDWRIVDQLQSDSQPFTLTT